MISTFLLVVIGWIFFRSGSIGQAVDYIGRMFDRSLMEMPVYSVGMSKTISGIVILMLVEWFQRNKKHGLEIAFIHSHFIKWSVYYVIIAIILEYGANSQSFIYFQF